MRGDDGKSGRLFSYIDLEDRVWVDHPLRPIREIANAALASLAGEFAALYSGIGRPSVPPEKLLRAMLLSGAVCGLAGSMLVLGVHHRYIDGSITAPGYAWTGFTAMLLAGGEPLATETGG